MANDKIKMGVKPKSFEKAVGIVLLDGSVADIMVNFIYRTRSEFAALFNEVAAAAAATAADPKAAEAAPKTVADYFKQQDESGVEFVLKIADGWL